MMQPTVSVLIAAYQAERFLPEALASVARQTNARWELVVVEDGSRDSTEALVAQFAATHSATWVCYENLDVNQGVAAARNRLLELARGEIVAFLDADDRWEADHLVSLLTCLEKGHALACTPIAFWDGDREQAGGMHAPTAGQLAQPATSLYQESFIQTSSCVALPRSTIERVGRFDETLRIGEDRDYWFRALEGGGTLGCTAAPTCRYTKHQSSSMAKTLLVAEQTVRFYEKHRHAAGISARTARRALADALRTLGRLSRRDDPPAARRAFWRAWQIWPPALDLPLRALSARWSIAR